MNITGVKSIIENKVKSYRIELDKLVTNGHSICELIIDENNKSFTARLYGGEVYTYGWDASGDFIESLIQLFNRKDSLYRSIANFQLHNIVDIQKTTENIRKRIDLCESVFNTGTSNESLFCEARRVLEELEELIDVTEDHFTELYFAKFSSDIREEIIGNFPNEHEYVVCKKDEDAYVFCEKVAPILANVLVETYDKKIVI